MRNAYSMPTLSACARPQFLHEHARTFCVSTPALYSLPQTGQVSIPWREIKREGEREGGKEGERVRKRERGRKRERERVGEKE